MLSFRRVSAGRHLKDVFAVTPIIVKARYSICIRGAGNTWHAIGVCA
jgi:hypothetical protein